MGKTRNLNGLPNSLVQRYFSTLFYWQSGYMPDWIWYAAIEKSLFEIEIDIINRTISPKELQITPLIAFLPELNKTINRTLQSNNFEKGFIIEAKMEISVSQKYEALKLISGTGILKDINGKIYRGKTISEKAYDKPFKKFPATTLIRTVSSNCTTPKPKKWWKIW